MALDTAVPAQTGRRSDSTDNILEVQNLKKHFKIGGGFLARRSALNIRAVDDVSFSVRRGETFGLVGESGCGKTTLGQTIIRLYNPTEGSIIFNGTDISKLNANDLRKHRRGDADDLPGSLGLARSTHDRRVHYRGAAEYLWDRHAAGTPGEGAGATARCRTQ